MRFFGSTGKQKIKMHVEEFSDMHFYSKEVRDTAGNRYLFWTYCIAESETLFTSIMDYFCIMAIYVFIMHYVLAFIQFRGNAKL